MSKVLVIGDTHIPFVHPNYLRFIEETASWFQPDIIVHIGDLVDHHALSRFVSDPDGYSAGHEQKASLIEVERWAKAFSNVVWIIGNHDKRPFNRAFDAQIPEAFLRPLSEVYGLPKSWEPKTSIIIDNVKYVHGENSGGPQSWQLFGSKQGISSVIGHSHTIGGVRYYQQPGKSLFTLSVGCGIDKESYAMAYMKDLPVEPILGCGLVIDGIEARFLPMDMSERRNYRKRRQIL